VKPGGLHSVLRTSSASLLAVLLSQRILSQRGLHFPDRSAPIGTNGTFCPFDRYVPQQFAIELSRCASHQLSAISQKQKAES
jgi:hypothetical protein